MDTHLTQWPARGMLRRNSVDNLHRAVREISLVSLRLDKLSTWITIGLRESQSFCVLAVLVYLYWPACRP